MSGQKLYLRRSEARQLLGVSEQVFTKLVQIGRLQPVHLTPNGRAFFATAQVTALATPTPNPKTK